MTQRVSDDRATDLSTDIGVSAASVAEDRAVVRAKSRGARHDAALLAARAEAAIAEAEQAGRVAVSALAEADDLRRAMQTRGTIDMAKGIIIAVQGVDPDAAFDILRQASQRSHVKLVDVAAKIVDAAITRTLTAQPWAAGADSTDESPPCTDRACCCGSAAAAPTPDRLRDEA